MITLYDLVVAGDRRPSPFCWRTKLALRHKGLEWREVPVGFTEKEKIAFAGSRTVPVICDHAHGDKPVKDSWAIAQHLDEAYPAHPLLGSGAERSFAMFVNHWVDTAVHAALFPLIVADIWSRTRPEDQNYFRESREKRLGTTLEEAQQAARASRVPAFRTSLEPARRMLASQPFLVGAAAGYPDYILMGAFMWARTVHPASFLEATDPLEAWQERMLDLFDGYARRTLAAA
jgi:glutathione S-transferase